MIWRMRRRDMIRVLLAVAGALALAVGVMQGGFQDTLRKAVYLCMECVGIG